MERVTVRERVTEMERVIARVIAERMEWSERWRG